MHGKEKGEARLVRSIELGEKRRGGKINKRGNRNCRMSVKQF